MDADIRRPTVKLRELASLLASPHAVDHLVGLGHVRAMEDPAQAPILIHVLRTCDPGIAHHVLERLTSFGSQAVRGALDRMLDSDAPHPMSAVAYVRRAKTRASNGLLLSWLPRSEPAVQLEILGVLADTADARMWAALKEVLPRLDGDAALEAARLLSTLPARRALTRGPRTVVNRPQAFRLAAARPSLAWVPPSGADLALLAASALTSLPVLAHSKGPATPSELVALFTLIVAASRCLVGWPRLGLLRA